MSKFYCLLSFLCLTFCFYSCNDDDIIENDSQEPEVPVFDIPGNKEVKFEGDDRFLIRNPCCGWGIYDDASGEVANAETYWRDQDEAARRYASFFYIRWRWSEMEPEEGKYAWLYDENFKKLIQGAIDRGLKLHFRVYNNSKDNLYPSTPDYVREAGAQGFMVRANTWSDVSEHWTPYIDDPIYREKFEKFIKAFAEEFDNPDIVDCYDGASVGQWGEGNDLELRDKSPQGYREALTWLTDVHKKYFKNIILLIGTGNEFGYELEKELAINGSGYGFRCDGLGSHWHSLELQQKLLNDYGKTLLIGESCYWGGNYQTGLRDDIKNDPVYHYNTWRDVYEATCKQAIDQHYNTLDLRTPWETIGWMHDAPDLIQKFIVEGGYRLYPSVISFPEKVNRQQEYVLGHKWENMGNGYLPNNLPNWHYKYKIAFALLQNGDVKKTFVDIPGDPSLILRYSPLNSKVDVDFSDVLPGEYELGVAIVNTSKENVPEIKLAIKNIDNINGWSKVGNIIVE